ncbi:MAG: alpha/beta hydrolase [Hyphomicrobiales bacterium]
MTKLKKRMYLGAGALLLVILLLGGWLFYFLVLGPRIAIRHAEEFSFRRMTVAQLEEPGMYRFYFVTNRRPKSDEGPLKERLSNERHEQLKFGYFDTKIEPSLGLGMLVNPSDWLLNEEIEVTDIQLSQRANFVTALQERVQASPHKSLLILLHGFREGFASALQKTAFFGHVLDINAPILVFDWPGNQGSTLSGYRRAQQVARASGADLAKTIAVTVDEIRPEQVWIVANSMGGEVVIKAFKSLFESGVLRGTETVIEDVVLTAPDVGRDELNERFKREISALARNLTVYVSSNDQALLMSRIVNRQKRGGESTLDIANPDQFEEALATLELTDDNDGVITLVDVTPVNRTRNFHNFSLETPEFFDDLFLRLSNQRDPNSRPEYKVRTNKGNVYWILTRAR